MRRKIRILPAALASLAALAGAAEARTIDLVSVLAQYGAPRAGVIDLGEVKIEILSTPSSMMLNGAELEKPALMRNCEGYISDFCAPSTLLVAKGDFSRTESPMLKIVVANGFEISNLNFSGHSTMKRARTPIEINGALTTIAEAQASSFTTLVLAFGGARNYSLEAFDIERQLETPLPAAGYAMIAGLFGLAFATRGGKRRQRELN